MQTDYTSIQTDRVGGVSVILVMILQYSRGSVAYWVTLSES